MEELVSHKKKPTKIEEMSKEQIRRAITKKRECNAKAQIIVEKLLEDSVTEEFLLRSLPDVSRSHLEDVVEERALARLCGYPLCSAPLTDKDIPKQKYRISLKTNKVYDITARKNFCSNTCYQAAVHVMNQMLTSPLWFREYEDIPKFNLLPMGTLGRLGQEIDVSIIEKLPSAAVKVQMFTSVNDFTSASLADLPDHDQEGNNENESEGSHAHSTSSGGTKTIVKDNMTKLEETNMSDRENNQTHSQNINENEKKKCIPANTIRNPLNIVGDVVEKLVKPVDPIIATQPVANRQKPARKVVQKKQPSVTAVTAEVEKCLAEWFTLDTLLFLFGEIKVREMVADKGECVKEYLNNYSKSIFYNSNTYDQYQILCRKLNMLELEDKKLDAQTLQREMKPLPDYSVLQAESKKMELKVKAFLSGATDTPALDQEQTDIDPPTAGEQVTQLPLVDKNAQNALRRRIVCQQLSKVLPDLLRSLGLQGLSIDSDVRLLVNTFKLRPNNVMFKPLQWTLIALALVRLLGLRSGRLAAALGARPASERVQLLLLSYGQAGAYLDRLAAWLADADRLLRADTQLTPDSHT